MKGTTTLHCFDMNGTLCFDDNGDICQSVDFDYDAIDGITEEPEDDRLNELFEILDWLSNCNSFAAIKERSVQLVNITHHDKLNKRPSLRRFIKNTPVWHSSLIASKIGDYLLQARYDRDMGLRAVVLISQYRRCALFPDIIPTQEDIADLCGVGRSAVCKTIKKMEECFGI